MTVFCEVTDYGRTWPVASPEHPVHYILHDGGRKEYGDNVTGDVTPAQDYLAGILRHSLEASGFLPAADHAPPPALVLFANWGSHHRLDPETAMRFPDLARRHLIERGRLVGGPRYAHENFETKEYKLFPPLSNRGARGSFLREQTEQSLYFVIVSAYDLAAFARNEHRLVWRTTMTVNAVGINMAESLPPLVLTAGPYFGRQTKDAEIVVRHVKRGSVILGPLSVLPSDAPLPAAK